MSDFLPNSEICVQFYMQMNWIQNSNNSRQLSPSSIEEGGLYRRDYIQPPAYAQGERLAGFCGSIWIIRRAGKIIIGGGRRLYNCVTRQAGWKCVLRELPWVVSIPSDDSCPQKISPPPPKFPIPHFSLERARGVPRSSTLNQKDPTVLIRNSIVSAVPTPRSSRHINWKQRERREKHTKESKSPSI